MLSASLNLPTRSSMKIKTKSKQKTKAVIAKSMSSKSEALEQFINLLEDKKGQIKVQTLINLLKGYGLYKPTNDAQRVLRRLAPNREGLIQREALIDFFNEQFRYERGKLTQLDYVRVFESFCRDGTLTFVHLMKNFDQLANKISEKEAKSLIKLFSKGKDYLTQQDFVSALYKPVVQKKVIKK